MVTFGIIGLIIIELRERSIISKEKKGIDNPTDVSDTHTQSTTNTVIEWPSVTELTSSSTS